MVQAVRQGGSLRQVARQFRVGVATVKLWVDKAQGQRLDRVDFSNRPPGRRCAINRTGAKMEDLILQARSELKEKSALGEYGARAIHQQLLAQAQPGLPCERTIGRILVRRGGVEPSRRLRHTPPPKGWYLPQLASLGAELDGIDFVEGLAIKGGVDFEVLNVISLYGALAQTYLQQGGHSAKSALEALLTHWRALGCPGFAQFDNDTRYQGPHNRKGIVSRVMRLCLALQITPVFIPPREPGFQAAIENFNGLWQAKVWRRFEFASLQAVQEQSQRFHQARRQQLAQREEQAPSRRPIPQHWQLNLQQSLQGKIIYLRRTSDQGRVEMMGEHFVVDPHWIHRLVRCELDLQENRIQFFALRRREPAHQPLLNDLPFEVSRKKFHE